MKKKSLRSLSAIMSTICIAMVFLPTYMSHPFNIGSAIVIPVCAVGFGLLGSAFIEGWSLISGGNDDEDSLFIRMVSAIGFIVGIASFVLVKGLAEMTINLSGAILLAVFLTAAVSRIAAETILIKEAIIASIARREEKRKIIADLS
ncbi:MAG: hypothetical protein NT165_03450 [Candidatus Falkowbacteria bacterium]|nr:hypothetical protein [Candidatus Falkowbacteria bacterium]